MPESVIGDQLAERLEALDVQGPPEKDYVYVKSDMETPRTPDSANELPSTAWEPTLSISAAEHWEKELLQDPKVSLLLSYPFIPSCLAPNLPADDEIQNRLALSALSGTDPKQVLTQRSATIADTQNFNIKIKLEGAPITNQRSSGRCWLFAATNVFRVAIMRRYNLKEFELSQSYLFFWDKLEKANYFLEQVLDTTDEELDGRLVQTLMASPVGDGGQWDMVANLVEKYGLVGAYWATSRLRVR